MKDSDSVEKVVTDFEEAMANDTLFRTKLNYNNMVVQHAKTPEIQNWLRTRIQSLLESVAREIGRRKCKMDICETCSKYGECAQIIRNLTKEV